MSPSIECHSTQLSDLLRRIVRPVVPILGASCLLAVLLAGSMVQAKADGVIGSYLAGGFAVKQRDTAAAVDYFRRALKRDPKNILLIDSSFRVEAAEGHQERATALARQLVKRPGHRLSRVWMAAVEVKARRYKSAMRHVDGVTGNATINKLTRGLAKAWVYLQQGKSTRARRLLRRLRLAEAARNYVRYHRALLADVAGRGKEAGRHYEAVFANDQKTPRIALAYARHAAHRGQFTLAKKILRQHLESVQDVEQPLVHDLLEKVDGKQAIKLLVENPVQGFFEVFYGLGEALATEGGVSLGAFYLQTSLILRPKSPFALSALANVYELTKRYAAAIDVYDRIPKDTPLRKAIDIRKAYNLNSLDKVDEAQALLEAAAAADATDIKPLVTLGDIMRSRKRYEEAITQYARVIELTPEPEERHWVYWYARGTSYERLKKWPQAEADLLKALELSPEQPLVLNYLGYSWIDQNRNLQRGLRMIEEAVKAKPGDGYIVDSLGWAHYRLGNFDLAVQHLERAVELRPEDPTLNDHLGDGYWRVGRHREARFQWAQALTLKPEPAEVGKIKKKLREGLADNTDAKVADQALSKGRQAVSGKRVKNNFGPVAPVR